MDRSSARSDMAYAGMIQLEDGSWVPTSYFERSSRDSAGVAPRRRHDSRRIPGSFIVDLAPGLDPHEIAPEIAAEYGGEVDFVYDEVVGGFAFKGPDDVRERMERDPRIRGVDADYEAYLVGHTLPIERTAIRAPEAWTTSQGAGAVVAIIDTGVNDSHPQLSGRVLGKDGSCVGESGSSAGADTSGHGTTVAGHTFGHYGALPDASGYAVKVFPNGSSSTSYSNVICGLNLVKSWAASRGIHAANLSLSGGSSSSSLQTAVRDLRNAGVVVVAAAGNSGGSVGYPAQYPEAIAVSALDRTNSVLASFSSRGSQVDLGAPGQSLLSLTLSGCCASGSGTSFSAPQVTAAAALVKSRSPGLTPAEVLSELQKTGLCPPGTTLDANTDGGNCGGPARNGDSDGYTEPALNLEGAAKGLDGLPQVSIVSPTADQAIRDTSSPIVISATDDDSAYNALDVEVKVGESGEFRQASFSGTSSGCPVAGSCHEITWPAGMPEGPVRIVARATELENGTAKATVDVVVDLVDDPPTVSWVSPMAGATVGSPVLLRVSATDDRGLGGVEVFEGTEERAALTQSGSYYEASIALSQGVHSLSVVATDSGGHSTNAERTLTVAPLLHQQTFDSTAGWTGGWYESSSSSLWHPTSGCSAGASSPPFAYYGKDSSCTFDTSSSAYLYSPVLRGLPTNERLLLSLDVKEKVESCSGCSRDRRYIQVNDGGGWRTIDYRHAGSDSGSGQWESRQYLADACSGRLQIRFYFYPTSSTNNAYFGWALDNVRLARSGEPLTCSSSDDDD